MGVDPLSFPTSPTAEASTLGKAPSCVVFAASNQTLSDDKLRGSGWEDRKVEGDADPENSELRSYAESLWSKEEGGPSQCGDSLEVRKS